MKPYRKPEKLAAIAAWMGQWKKVHKKFPVLRDWREVGVASTAHAQYLLERMVTAGMVELSERGRVVKVLPRKNWLLTQERKSV
jgi:hypothetical protein